MAHNCKAAIIHCIDFRLGPAIKAYMEERGLLGDCDVIAVAGAAKDLVEPGSESDRDFLMRQIDISKQLHHINTVILMNHTDCGAYGGRTAFVSTNEEEENHRSHMAQAAALIKDKYPELNVEMVLADLREDGAVSFI